MSLFGGMEISATGLTANRAAMDVTAENLANAQTAGYRRKTVVMQEVSQGGGFGAQLASAIGSGKRPGGVEVAQIAEDSTPGRRTYDPTNPSADAQGYVTMPNVDTVTEMVDLISSQRAYEANVTAMQASKTMFSKTIDLLK